jgi:hypothetical protein
MSRPARPASFAGLRQHVQEFIEQANNKVHLRPALDYHSPEEFERSQNPK